MNNLLSVSENPIISIIVPVYNVKDYLTECINSILLQRFTDFELIIVDDGSTDGSGKLCDILAEKDVRAKVIHKPNGGLSSARNAGIDVAKGKYLGFVDSDDWISPDMYHVLYDAAVRFNAQLVDCSLQSIFPDGKKEYETQNTGKVIICDSVYALFNQLNWSSFRPTPPTKLYAAELFADGLRYAQGLYHEDEFLTYKLLHKAQKLVYIDEAYYYYRREREGSITSQFNQKRLYTWDAYHERLVYFKANEELNVLVPRMTECYVWLALDLIYKAYQANIKTSHVKRIIEQMRSDYVELMKYQLPMEYKYELAMLYQSHRKFIKYRSNTRFANRVRTHAKWHLGNLVQ